MAMIKATAPLTRSGNNHEAANQPVAHTVPPPTRMGERNQAQVDQWLGFLGSQTTKPALSISAPSAPAERAADAWADQAMRPAGSAFGPGQRLPPVQTGATGLGSHQVVHRKPAGGPPVRTSLAHTGLTPGTLGSGSPLPASEREFLEQRFGRDLSAVRVHHDAASDRAAQSIQARAFAIGTDIGFAKGEYRPGTPAGRHLIAHETAHTIQHQSAAGAAPQTIYRLPVTPRDAAGDRIPPDRSKVDVPPIPDVDLSPTGTGKIAATVTFNDPKIVHMSWELYDASDAMVDGISTMPGSATATTETFLRDAAALKAKGIKGRCLLRCIGLDAANKVVSYADRQFWGWETTPTGTAPDIAALESRKTALGKVVAKKSGKSFGEVGKAFTELTDVEHDLGILKTGTGTHVGDHCPVQPAGAVVTNCTNIVLDVLEKTFTQQGKGADWLKVKAKMMEITKLGGRTKMSGVDLQGALQSEAGWKGVYWAPDPNYLVPKADLEGANSDEASFTSGIASSNKTYYKDTPKKGYPGVTVDHSVTKYAPEKPTDPLQPASKATKTTTQLDKLKKLNFGVLSAHGGYHMTLIMNGRVMEVHWSLDATNIDLIEETDLETWAVGPVSGFHYYASGVIVAPASDVDAAFK